MPEQIVMPRLSDTMSEGTIGKWLKQVGDRIEKSDALLELQTDKANMELEAYTAGWLDQILLEEGGTAPIGSVIGVIRLEGEAAQAARGASQATGGPPAATVATAASPTAAPVLAAAIASPVASAASRLRASPLARKLAAGLGIDLTQVQGTGPNGRIVKADVERRAAAPTAPPKPLTAPTAMPTSPVEGARLAPLNRFQQVIARRMTESKSQVPHFQVTSDIDMTQTIELRRRLNEAWGKEHAISFNDLVAKACAFALLKYPEVNAYWRDGQLEYHDYVNIGLAVALEGALLVPVVKGCHAKSLRQIGQASRTVIEKARQGKLTIDEQTGGTFTISNLGMFDVEEFTAIINQPEAAILAVGSIKPTPVVVDGQVAIAQRLRVTLSSDHRVIYGATAAQFLQEVKRLLESPHNLVQ